MAVDELAVRRLVALGRQNGALTLTQIRSILPVDRMTEAQIGEALEKVEAAGIPIEIDDALLALRAGQPHDLYARARRGSGPEEPSGPPYIPRGRGPYIPQGHAPDLERPRAAETSEPMPSSRHANRLVMVALIITALLFVVGYLLLRSG